MSLSPRRYRLRLCTLAVVGIALLPVVNCAQQQNSTGKHSLKFIVKGDERSLPKNTGKQPDECGVKSLEILADGTRPDFSPDGKLIAFDRKVKGTFELFIMNSDSNNQRCLTCGRKIPPELRKKHKGKATFHPSGSYLLFGSENEHGNHGFVATPGIGDNHDLWVRGLDKNTYWRLTKLPKNYAVQYPRFSADGKKLLWSERYEKGKFRSVGREYGIWKLKLADFEITSKGPRLSNIRELEPGGKGFYEPHGFSPDGHTIIFTAALEPDKPQIYGTIYTYDLRSKKLTKLTKDDYLHHEQALYSPGGSKISLMIGPFVGLSRLAYKTDLYLMDADGSNRVRLTHFNQQGHLDYRGGSTIIDKNVWHPTGTEIVSAYHVIKKRESKVFKVKLRGACG